MDRFKWALNTSTLLPFRLNVIQQIEIAAEAGYEGIELWVSDIERYFSNGGTRQQLRKRLEDAGLSFVNAIAFFKWTDVDDTERKRGLEQAEQEMRMLAELGCEAVAAPPFGNVEGSSLEFIARNFAVLSEIGRRIGIEPYLEFWGRAKKLSRLSECLYVAVESGVTDARILLDPFHMYTGGSRLNDLQYLHGKNIGIVHANDYPAVPSVQTIADQDRVFPGEGIMPTARLAQLLAQTGYRGYLSLELFIENYGVKSALEVARYGLKKLKNEFTINYN